VLERTILGATESIRFPEYLWENVRARIDTGAKTSAMHCSKVVVLNTERGNLLQFWLETDSSDDDVCFSTSEFQERKVRSSFGEVETRFTIKALVVIGGKRIRGKFTLTNRKKMSYPVLIGRNFLRGRFLVDVSQGNTLAG
jgi:hypothetical protein